MSQIQFHRPGEFCTIVLETYAAGVDGYRIDGYSLPYVHRVFLPKNSDGYILEADGYSSGTQLFTRLDVGLYYYSFSLPAKIIGTYLFDVSYYDSLVDEIRQTSVSVVAQAVSGNLGLRASS